MVSCPFCGAIKVQPLDSRQLRTFVALAKTGGFTSAAREVFLSQSAVSHSVQALEQDVGCRLFDRVGKKVLLTQAGETLLVHAKRVLNEMGLARETLGHLNKWGQSRIRIAASSTVCQYILPSVLRKFKAEYPDCVMTIEPADASKSVELLENNRIDIAISLKPNQLDKLSFKPLFKDELMFIINPNHEWALKGRVIRSQIQKQKFVLYNKASQTFRMIESFFRRDEIGINTLIELGSMDAIKELVKLGLGISVMAPWVARSEIEEGSIVALPLGRRLLSRQWGILTWRNRPLNLPEEKFVGFCREAAGSMIRLADLSVKSPPVSSEGLPVAC
jgi:DNA-binding transcriptional LysR family regulator